uniref:peptidase inhibitor 16-like isoform X1 n=1 Tax=Styela clava TaxID=7725 RepID=UPI0019392A49|nr:peptidase inhibitor 16-like isoform X1 [Styela clava]
MISTILANGLLLVILGPISIEGGPSDFLYISPMEQEHEQQWVDAHNHFRRQVDNPEAADMRLMTWDDELAELAESVVKTCTYQHSSVSKLQTSFFSYAGENLYAGSQYYFHELMANDGLTKLWYDEDIFYNYTTTGCQSGEQCGHYTQIVWAETYKVGCAIAQCSDITYGHGSTFVSCNYGPGGNKVLAGGAAFRPYISGTPCSQCGTEDQCIDKLCNNTERDVPFTTTTVAPTTVEITTVQETTTLLATEMVTTVMNETDRDLVTSTATEATTVERTTPYETLLTTELTTSLTSEIAELTTNVATELPTAELTSVLTTNFATEKTSGFTSVFTTLLTTGITSTSKEMNATYQSTTPCSGNTSCETNITSTSSSRSCLVTERASIFLYSLLPLIICRLDIF